MSNDPLETLLRQWDDANLRGLRQRTQPCDNGPSMALLYLHVVEGFELSMDQARHLDTCPYCLHMRERIESRTADGAFQSDRPAGRLVRRSAKDAGDPRRSDQLARRPRSSSPLSRRRWAMRGSLAAASVLIAILLWPYNGTHRAVAGFLQEVGFSPPLPVAAAWTDSDDEDVRQAQQAVAEARIELEEALSAGQRDILDPWIPWTKLYRHLKVLGKWEEALSETHAFVEFAREQDQKPDRYSMYYSGLFDLANTYAALGDYDAALRHHQDSLAVAREYQQWLHGRAQPEIQPPQAYARAMANALVPRLWALSTLSAAQGDQKAAWAYHNEAGKLLTNYFRQECRHRELRADADASLEDVCALVVADDDNGLESMVVKVREHLLRRATLLRLDRNLDAATRALDLAATLPDYPFADESRLDFNEPMERLRLAIARGDFAAALAAADEARQHTRAVSLSDSTGRNVSKPPIGIIACAELQFLKGVVIAALSRSAPEAIRLVDLALNVVDKAAASLSPAEGERFLHLFTEWKSVRNRLR